MKNFYKKYFPYILLILRLLSVEYIKNILDITINSSALNNNSRIELYIQKIIGLNPFNLLIEYFFEFEFNNMYQKYFADIVTLLLNKFTPEDLIRNFFIKNNFIEKFIEYSVNNHLFKFDSGKTITSGNIAICTQIIKTILSSENNFVKEFIERGILILFNLFIF